MSRRHWHQIWHLLRSLAIALVLSAALGHSAPQAHAQDPRIAAAQQELATLADAEEFAAIDTSVYVALEALNDGGATNPGSIDWINNGGGSYVIPPSQGQFNAARKLFNTQFGQPAAWGGPYVAFQQGKTQTGATPYDQGSPLDPWGQPYLFFSPIGLLRGDAGTVTPESYADAFDRYTIVSYGPDGVKSGDDLAYQFGGGVSAFALSNILGSGVGTTSLGTAAPKTAAFKSAAFTAQTGQTITLRGLNLGGSSAGAQVFFNATDISASITAWRVVSSSPQQRVEIDVDLPASLSGAGDLTVVRGAARTNALALILPDAPVDAATDWLLYQ